MITVRWTASVLVAAALTFGTVGAPAAYAATGSAGTGSSATGSSSGSADPETLGMAKFVFCYLGGLITHAWTPTARPSACLP